MRYIDTVYIKQQLVVAGGTGYSVYLLGSPSLVLHNCTMY